MLLGHDDDNAAQDVGRLRVTYHHNFFDGSDQRNPRVRFAEPVHVYNNYYRNSGDYGVASTMNAGARRGGQLLRNGQRPVPPGRADFSGDLGRLVARGNSSSTCTTRSRPAARSSEPRRTTRTPSTLPAAVPTIVPAQA